MVTLVTLGRLADLEKRLTDLGLEDYRAAVDEALHALGAPTHKFLRTGEAARALGVSIPTVKRWGRRGILPIQRVKGRWLVPAESVERLQRAATADKQVEPLDEVGAPLPSEQQRRMLALGRKANRGTLTAVERTEYEQLIRRAERRSACAALAAVASRSVEQAAALSVEAGQTLGPAQ